MHCSAHGRDDCEDHKPLCIVVRSGKGVADHGGGGGSLWGRCLGAACGTALVWRTHAQGCFVLTELLLQTSWGQARSFSFKRCCLDLFAEYSSIFHCVPCLE